MDRLSPADFHAVYGFRRPDVRPLEGSRQFAVSTIPSPSPESSGAQVLPSSHYIFPGWCLSGLGSGLPFKVSPNLSGSAPPVFQTSTQVFLKSAAYAIPPRPRSAVLVMIGHAARFYISVSSSPVCACVGICDAYLGCPILSVESLLSQRSAKLKTFSPAV